MQPGRFLFTLCLLVAGVTPAATQTAAPPSDAANSMLGGWEMSNADRDKSCVITFKLEPAGRGLALELAKECATAFPTLKDVTAWTIDNDALRLIDARGTTLLEFNEVENGMFESARSTGTLYFLQTVAAAQGRGHTPDQMFGTWNFIRANGKAICQITLMDTAADTESFALEIKPGCDQLITRFAPRAWRMDRGQFVLLPVKGNIWRFEEEETNNWHRIPEGRQPLLLVKE